MTSGNRHSSSPPTPDLHAGFRDYSWWIPIALFATVALVLVVVFTARPTYRYFKLQRATKLATQAAALIDAGELTRAQGPLAAAMALTPENPEVIRQSARYSTRLQLPQSLQYWEMLEATGTATEADVREHAGVALDLHRTDVAGRALAKLREMNINSPESWLLLLRHDSQRDDLNTARANIHGALNRFPNDPRLTLAAGAFLFQQPENQEEEMRGRSLLWSLAIGTNAQSAAAIQLLASSSRVDRSEKKILVTLLKKRPNPTPSEQLLADEIQWETQPELRADLIQNQFNIGRNSKSSADRIRIAEWLSSRGADQEAVTLLPSTLARTNLVALERRLQSLAHLKRWDEIETELAASASNSNTDSMLRYTFQALTASQTGRTNDALAHFANAVVSCGADPRRLYFVATAAEKSGQAAAAVKAWTALLDSPTFAVKAGQAMLRILASMDDLPSTERAFKKLLTFAPTNTALIRDLAITQSLLGTRLRENLETIGPLVQKNPQDPGLRQALALIYLRLGNAPAALDQLETLPESADETVLSRVIHVAVLGANRQRVRARTLAASLAKAKLRNVERELVADWLPNPQ